MIGARSRDQRERREAGRRSRARRSRCARQFVNLFVPSKDSREWLRRLVIKLLFSLPLLQLGLRFFGAKSILAGRPD